MLICIKQRLLRNDGSAFASHRRHALCRGNAIDKKQSSLLFVGVAQLVEHRTHKPGVVGSIPTSDTLQINKICDNLKNTRS